MRPAEVLRILLRNGFVVPVPYHRGDVPRPVLKSIAAQAGKHPGEFGL